MSDFITIIQSVGLFIAGSLFGMLLSLLFINRKDEKRNE